MRGYVYFTDDIKKQTSAHISPCSPVKHNTSFSCFLLTDRTTVNCCGYTHSISFIHNYDTQSTPYPFVGYGI